MSFFKGINMEYKHLIDIKKIQEETGLSVPEISEKISVTKSVIYKWSWPKYDGGCRPSYNAIIELLKLGASTETLFGVSVEQKVQQKEKKISHKEILSSLREALSLLDDASASSQE